MGKTRGNRGEVTAVALSSKLERYELLEEVTLFAPGGPAGGVKYEVEETWFHLGTLVFKFAGVDDISTAERLYGSEVRIPASQRVELQHGVDGRQRPWKEVPVGNGDESVPDHGRRRVALVVKSYSASSGRSSSVSKALFHRELL